MQKKKEKTKNVENTSIKKRKRVKKRKNIKIREAKMFLRVMKNLKSKQVTKISGVPMMGTLITVNLRNLVSVKTSGNVAVLSYMILIIQIVR